MDGNHLVVANVFKWIFWVGLNKENTFVMLKFVWMGTIWRLPMSLSQYFVFDLIKRILLYCWSLCGWEPFGGCQWATSHHFRRQLWKLMLGPGLEHQQIDFACQLFTQYKNDYRKRYKYRWKYTIYKYRHKSNGKKPRHHTSLQI